MFKNLKLGLAVLALVSCVAISSAQGGGQGGGQGRGGQRGNMGGGMVTEMTLAGNPSAQKELELTDDQKSKITELATSLRPQRGQGGGAQGGGQQDRDAMMKAREEAAAKAHTALAGILDEKQMKRLGEMVIQVNGANDPKTQKALGLSEDQISKIKELNTKAQAANRALGQKVQDGDMTREDMMATMTKNAATLKSEIEKVLTPEQAAKLKEMGGKPFTYVPSMGRRGGGN